jgi:hypothetical protein
LLNRELGSWTNNRVHINGLVSSYEPGKYVDVQDPTGVIRSRIVQITQVQQDARVDIWGFFTVASNKVALSSAFFEVAAPTPRPAVAPPPTGPLGAGGARKELSKISDILRLPRDEAALQIPVRLHGAVTYADPGWQIGFLQDSTAAVYFNLTYGKTT